MEIEWEDDGPDGPSNAKDSRLQQDEEPELDWDNDESSDSSGRQNRGSNGPEEPKPRPERAETKPPAKSKPKGMSTKAKLGIIFGIGAGGLLILVILGVALISGGGGLLNLDPSADFTVSEDDALTLVPIEMDASDSSDTDGDIVEYRWDFDSDGEIDNTTDEPEITYAFPDNGEYKITLEVEDDGGAVASTSKGITINNRPPELSASSSHSQALTYDVITYSCGAIDKDGELTSCTWDFDGDGTADWTGTPGESTELIYQFEQDGFFISTFKAMDDDGDETEETLDITILNQPPNVVVDIPKTTYYTYETINVSLTVEDIDGSLQHIDLDYDGDGTVDNTIKTIQFAYEYTDDGPNTLTINAYDDDGDFSKTEVQLTILNRPPVVEAGIDSLTKPYTMITHQQLLFYAVVTDIDGSLEEYKWDFDGDGSWDFSDYQSPNTTHSYTDDGTFKVMFFTKDDDDATTMDTFDVTVNNQAPIVTLEADETEVLTYTSVTYTVEGDDPDGTIVSYEWDFDGDGYFDYGPTSSNMVDHSFIEDGVYNTKVRVTDDDEAQTDETIEITVLNSVPEASINFMNNATTNQELHMVALASDVDGTVVLYEWDFDGDTLFDHSTSFNEAYHQYATEGQRIINLKVTDDDGGFCYAQKTVDILYNNPPGADAGTDITITMGDFATLDASNTTDPEGDDLIYSWDFETDGTYDVEDTYDLQVQHQYMVDGTYTATLKVSDGEKESTDTVTVYVLSSVQKWAVCIGISDYPGGGNDLYYCDDDADDWETYLTGKEYTVKKLIDSQGTWSNVQSEINWLKTNSDENDIVVFTFSGHGIYYSGDSHACLYDGDLKAASLASAMNGLSAESIFYFFDCCNSGSFSDNLGASNTYVAEGCRIDEYTVDDPSVTNGGFTYYFLNDGLRSHASWSAEDAFDNAYTRCVSRYGFHPQEDDGDAGSKFYF
jgi:PKD repeat protein